MAGYDPNEGRPRLAAWMARVADKTSPHYQEAHIILNKVVKRSKERELQSKF